MRSLNEGFGEWFTGEKSFSRKLTAVDLGVVFKTDEAV